MSELYALKDLKSCKEEDGLLKIAAHDAEIKSLEDCESSFF